MLVNMQGNVIDTEKIYRIESIYQSEEYLFYIHFINKNSVTIEHEDEKHLNEMREKLIEYWNQSKSTIPEIK